LGLVEVALQARRPAVPHLDYPCPLVIDLDAAAAPARPHIGEHQNTLSQVADVGGLEAEGFPGLGHVSKELADAARPDVVGGSSADTDEVHLEIRMARGDQV